MIPKLTTLAVAPLVFVLACTPSPEQTQAGEPAGPAPTDAAGNGIEIPPIIRRNLGITFAAVEVRRVAQTLRVPGAFEIRPLARHEYRMALSGRVELFVDQYDRVEPGQPLFRFRSPAWPELQHEIIVGEQAILTAQAEIAVADAKTVEAQRNLELARERVRALAEVNYKKADLEADAIELEASLPRLEAERQLAETRLANARRTRQQALLQAAAAVGVPQARLEREILVEGQPMPTYATMDWIEVVAMDPGVVEKLMVTDGAFVESPAAVLSTVNPTLVRFRAMALQGDLPKLQRAISARIVPPQSPGIPIGAGVEAQMTLGLEAHPVERTITLLATPEELAPWIRPGVSAFLEIVIDSTEAPALAIPRSAIVRDGLTHVFFRRSPSDPNTALRVEADMGVSDGRWVVLNSGVMRGDEVVLAGVYELTLATQQGPAPTGGGHVHADGTSHAAH